MKLFFIAATHPDDLELNLDLFVWQSCKDMALILWRAWCVDNYDTEPTIEPDNVFVVPCEPPTGQRIGILGWHTEILEA